MQEFPGTARGEAKPWPSTANEPRERWHQRSARPAPPRNPGSVTWRVAGLEPYPMAGACCGPRRWDPGECLQQGYIDTQPAVKGASA